jgi:hypothetical protein
MVFEPLVGGVKFSGVSTGSAGCARLSVDHAHKALAPLSSHSGTGRTRGTDGSNSSVESSANCLHRRQRITPGVSTTVIQQRNKVMPPRTVGQGLQSVFLIALEDLVAGLARNAERATDLAHRFAVQQLSDKPQRSSTTEHSFHGVRTSPERGTVLPMCPVRSVTYVSGRSQEGGEHSSRT